MLGAQLRGSRALAALLGVVCSATAARAANLDVPVSMSVKEQPLSKVMELIANITKTNILVEPSEAGKKVTVALNSVPARQAIDLIAKLNKLEVRDTSDGQEKIFVVAGQKLFQDVFEPGLNRTFVLRYAAAGKMAAILQKALSKSGTVGIEVDDRTNSLVVTGTKNLIDAVEALIAQLDKQIPQVLIDSKIVKVGTDVLKDIGFNWDWGTGFTNADGDQQIQGDGGGGTLFTFSERHRINTNADFFQGNNTGGAAVLKFGDFYRGNLFFDAAFRALETNSVARSLASPRLLAVNGATASLRIGDEVVYTGGNTQAPESKETGIVLDVTPRINKDGFITMDVTVEQSTATFQRPDFPTINKTTAKTTVQVRDGEEILLGGLVTETSNFSETKIPFLSDIPLVKHFFTRRRNQPISTELVILMTPRVIKQAVAGVGEVTGGGGDGLSDDASLGGGGSTTPGGKDAGKKPDGGKKPGGLDDDDLGFDDDDFGSLD